MTDSLPFELRNTHREPALLKSISNRGQQFGLVQWFDEIIIGAEFHCRYDRLHRVIGGQDDHGHAGVQHFDAFEGLQTSHARHGQVQTDRGGEMS